MCTPEYESRERRRIARNKVNELKSLWQRGNVAQQSADAAQEEAESLENELVETLAGEETSLRHELANV